MTAGDGNGWVQCACGHRHWGRFGSAGVLVVDRTDAAHVLLQHRAGWTHQGGSWAVPGGARDSHETPVEAALREAREETSLDTSLVDPRAEWVDDHGTWRYTTVLAALDGRPEVEPVNEESDAVRWWPVEEVETLRLHHGFAAAWPHLHRLLATTFADDTVG